MKPILRFFLPLALASLSLAPHRATAQPATVMADPTTGALFRPAASTFISGNSLLTTTGAAAAYQPLDSDLTAIAALTTTANGRSLLTASSLTLAGLGLANGATLDTIGAKTQTGTGNLVLATSPTLTTPNIGAATATSITGPTATNLTFTGGSSGASLVLGQGSSGVARITKAGSAAALTEVLRISNTTLTGGEFLNFNETDTAATPAYIARYNSSHATLANVFQFANAATSGPIWMSPVTGVVIDSTYNSPGNARLSVSPSGIGAGSQVQFGLGGFLTSAELHEGMISGGARWDQTAGSWRAVGTAAEIVSLNSTTGGIRFYVDSGLVNGATFSPTPISTITASGLGIFNISPSVALDVTGAGYFTGLLKTVQAGAGVEGFRLTNTTTSGSVYLNFNETTSTATPAYIIRYGSTNASSPNILEVNATGTGAKFRVLPAMSITDTTSASSSTTGALTIGSGSAASSVAIGGGNVNVGGTLAVGANIEMIGGANLRFAGAGGGLFYT